MHNSSRYVIFPFKSPAYWMTALLKLVKNITITANFDDLWCLTVMHTKSVHAYRLECFFTLYPASHVFYLRFFFLDNYEVCVELISRNTVSLFPIFLYFFLLNSPLFQSKPCAVHNHNEQVLTYAKYREVSATDLWRSPEVSRELVPIVPI